MAPRTKGPAASFPLVEEVKLLRDAVASLTREVFWLREDVARALARLPDSGSDAAKPSEAVPCGARASLTSQGEKPLSSTIDHPPLTEEKVAAQSNGRPVLPGELMQLWNERASKLLPRCSRMVGLREAAAKLLCSRFSLAELERALDVMNSDPFYTQKKQGKEWTANIDWFMKSENVLKLLEKPTAKERSASYFMPGHPRYNKETGNGQD